MPQLELQAGAAQPDVTLQRMLPNTNHNFRALHGICLMVFGQATRDECLGLSQMECLSSHDNNIDNMQLRMLHH